MMTPVEESPPVILLVDDEPRILSALQRLLRREGYRILTAGSGAAALSILDQESVNIILSDLRMPEMDGFAFLGAVQDRGLEAARVLMSGNADLKLVIDGVNEGRFSQFIEKPWVDDALKISLRKLIEAQQLARENKELMKALRSQNQMLNQASEKAASEIQQKERLFATISHEIRNPLHGIQGILELLSRDSVGRDQKLLSTAITSAGFMRQIIDDVLDYSKVEAGKMVLQKVAFSPVALATDIISLMQPMATGQQLLLDLYYEEAIAERYFKGDDFRIRQILNNLLSNAIKYTKKGSVGVEITVDPILKIAVMDTGIGIPEEKMASLFDAFVMTNDQHDRTFGGTGLGLTIVKNLTELMGGEIGVSARQGGGTVFTLSLPLESAAAEIAVAPTQNVDRVLDGMQVVVADDMAANRIIVENLLPRYGATVHGFSDGEGLLNFLSEFEGVPDLFLLDINMPGMKGDEVLRAIKAASPALAQVPAFAMSASLNFAGSEQIIKLFTGLFSKPFSVGQLLTLARQYAPSPPPLATTGPASDLSPAIGRTNRMRGDTDSPQFIGESGAEGFSPADKGALSAAEGALPGAEGSLLPAAEGSLPTAEGSLPTAEGSPSGAEGSLPTAEGSLPTAEGALPTAEGFNPEVDTLIEDMGVELVVDLSEAFKSSLSRALITAQLGDTSAQQIVDLAHALKPTATMLGFSQLSQCCQQIDGLRSSGDISPAIDRRIELLSKIEMTLVLIERLADFLKATSSVD
ncbi:response regulator [Pseudomonadales bacterium]|nr:response regulator [Pseudomonadales bacterium]